MQVLLFGVTKDITREDVLFIPADENIKNVGQLKIYLIKTYPGLGKLSSLAVAVNSNYAGEEVPIRAQDEVALIPPVSGG
jgi:molybdopterin synthase sulfur carrier subunit